MGKRLPHTPNSKIRAALRQLWLRSRERQAAIKRTGNCCELCGAKASVAKGREVKLEVHHVDGVLNWDELFAAVRKFLLVSPAKQMPLCKSCHDKQHNFPMHGAKGSAKATTNEGA
jgi:predicted HNH restriction endonuclease